MKIAIDYLLFSHFWFATPQLVLQADWQEVWHSPQPPFLALSHRLRVSRVLILSITCISDLSDSNGFPGEPPADSHLKIGKILAYHPHKVKVFQRFPPIKNVKKSKSSRSCRSQKKITKIVRFRRFLPETAGSEPVASHTRTQARTCHTTNVVIQCRRSGSLMRMTRESQDLTYLFWSFKRASYLPNCRKKLCFRLRKQRERNAKKK